MSRPQSEFRIGIVGSRGFSAQILTHLLETDWTVPIAVGAAGELATQQADSTSFADICRREGVELVETSDINDSDVGERLRQADLDAAICCGWTQVISETVLDLPRHGFLGLHASSLPEGRGGAPVNWQLIKGRDEVGLSLFYFVQEVDHGDILNQTTVPIEDRDDVATVYDRLTASACDLLDETLPELADGAVSAVSQSYDRATYWPQRKPKDGLIDWGKDASTQHDWIRALTRPYPGAFTFYEGEKLVVWRATPSDTTPSNASPGEVVAVVEGGGLDVRTGSDVLRLERVEYGHWPPMWGDDFARRVGLSAGSTLGERTDFPDWLYTGIRDGDGGFDYETNTSPGETVTVRAVCCSHARPREVGIRATLDGEPVFDAERRVRGWEFADIDVELPSAGAHTLKISFLEDGEVIDSRYLKLYGA